MNFIKLTTKQKLNNTKSINNTAHSILQLCHINSKKLFPTQINLTRESKEIKQFNLKLYELIKSGNYQNIEEFIDKKLITPNLFTYSILMNYYNYSNNNAKVLEIWYYLISKPISFIKLQPHYSILLDSLKFNSNLKELENIWESNKSKPLSSNNYLSYLEALIYFGKFDIAINCYESEILEGMKCLPVPAMKQLFEAELKKRNNFLMINSLNKKYELSRSNWYSLNILKNNKSY